MKKRKKRIFFRTNYRESWNYLNESKKFIYAIIVVFFLSFIFGFFVPTPDAVAEKIFEIINELIEETEGMSQTGLISFIFLNNLQSSFFGMIFGFFFGIFPMISAIFNGYLIGFVASLATKAEGFFVLWRLFPHGIFELPAIFISLGLGLRISTFIFQKDKIGSLKKYSFDSLKVFLFIVVPLLIIAAIVEGSLIFLFDN